MSTLPATFFPDHNENRMKSEGDLKSARQRFLTERPTNLNFLLEQRFSWMNEFLDNKTSVYELGCGCGFSKEFIKNPHLKLTDVSGEAWVDLHVDALNLPFPPNSVDALVCSHMIHHIAFPEKFFQGAIKVLKPGGLIVISEINTSWFMRFLLWLMKHEGWSYEVDLYSNQKPSNDPRDPWSANCAIPQILFDDPQKFESHFKDLKIIKNELTEFSIFPLSGGVIAKTKTIPLPRWALKVCHWIDQALIALFPGIFAMGRKVVLQKKL